MGTGAYRGTVANNTPPVVSSALTVSIAYSNINYQKRSATRYNDLALWYPFDEADGSMALDYSSNERNATLKNMSTANRVIGKMGGALSFDTPATKTSSDPSGQYLDLGTWSFGGAFTLSTWIKPDEWRKNGTIFNLPGGDDIHLRYKSVNERTLYLLMSGTAGGTESIFTNSTYLDWGKWIHLAISLENGGTNASTARIYKNGSLASTVTGMTVPDVVSRSSQYIGRSSTSWEAYFAGDLDDFRLYGSALSTTDIEAIFAETSAGVHYQAQALNNPTGFSATGLPVGLSIDPITGAITGHTTEIGDHNISLTASNLSGTSESKTVRITVTPQKPLLTTIATNSIGSNSATATATLLETGGVDTTLEVFYGAADKGETVIGWDSNSSLPNAQNTGDIELGMSGLSANTSYFYRIHASNSAGSTWSDAVSFTSGVQLQPPSISSEDASNIAGTSATTNGNLLSFDGSNQPTITLYYGLTDPFLPLSLGNTLKIWLDAEDTNSFQLSGSNITKWYNKFGNGYVFDQKTGDPSRTVVNGRNVVNLDGDDQLWTNDAFLASNYTILSVSRLTGGQNARLITSRDRNWILGYWGGRVDTFFFNEGLNWGGTYKADTNWQTGGYKNIWPTAVVVVVAW